MAIALARLKDISPARRSAFDILRQVDKGAFSSVLLASDDLKLQPLDRSLCHELVLGVLRWQLYLDRIIEHLSNRQVDDLDLGVRLALRLGLYQLRFLNRIPVSAAVNESVSLVRAAKLSSATSFVNAILRRAIRESHYDPASTIEDPAEKIAVQTSHPRWLIERWIESFGPATADSFARANNQQPPTAFRVVARQATEADVISRLTAAGAKLAQSSIAPGAWRINGATALLRELATSGQIYIQDEASQLVAQSLNVQTGQRVLDLCAAPGGKTTLIADRVNDDATIIANDYSPVRLETLGRSIAKQQLRSIQLMVVDAGSELPFPPDSFDRVLVDAPCSGTGTLRHNPEIRWRLTPADIEELAQQQQKFLRNVANVVRPGGRLLYSTCSVETEENEDVVRAFLEDDRRFVPAPVSSDGATTLRTWPQTEGCDGFFMAAFERSR